MKDELWGKILAALRAKTCSYFTDGGDEESSVKWGLLARNEVGSFQIFDYVKTIKSH